MARDERSPYLEDQRLEAELDSPAPMKGLMASMTEYLDVDTRRKGLRLLDYRTEYLKSAHWQATRRAALRRARYRCQGCGLQVDPTKRHLLDVHHLTYERLGAEDDADLQVLCRPCHMKEDGRA